MSTLRDKLRRLDGSAPPPPSQTGKSSGESEWKNQLAHELGVEIIEEQNSYLLIKEQLWPVFNDAAFEWLQAKGFEVIKFSSLIGKKEDTAIALRKAIFFDLETTGLAGGTGTFAFLVGMGFIETDAIRVRQYLLPDFSFEWLLLKHLQMVFPEYDYTVSFNGKTFDIPLLANRFVLNRLENILDTHYHIDILHAARRIWRNILPNCDLQSLESHVLGHQRKNDLPGHLIPHAYFEFINKRHLWMIQDVLEHNFWDVINMVLLTTRLAAAAEYPDRFLDTIEEKFALAEYYFKTRQDEAALNILESILKSENQLRPQQELQIFFTLAMVLKRKGMAQKSVHYLWKLLERNQTHPRVIEELAKYYEHQEKNYALALELVERGLTRLEMLQQLNRSIFSHSFYQALQHRRDRLRRRLQKHQSHNEMK